jgi:hypothetical protein
MAALLVQLACTCHNFQEAGTCLGPMGHCCRSAGPTPLYCMLLQQWPDPCCHMLSPPFKSQLLPT